MKPFQSYGTEPWHSMKIHFRTKHALICQSFCCCWASCHTYFSCGPASLWLGCAVDDVAAVMRSSTTGLIRPPKYMGTWPGAHTNNDRSSFNVRFHNPVPIANSQIRTITCITQKSINPSLNLRHRPCSKSFVIPSMFMSDSREPLEVKVRSPTRKSRAWNTGAGPQGTQGTAVSRTQLFLLGGRGLEVAGQDEVDDRCGRTVLIQGGVRLRLRDLSLKGSPSALHSGYVSCPCVRSGRDVRHASGDL